jgi:hypothetical protein
MVGDVSGELVSRRAASTAALAVLGSAAAGLVAPASSQATLADGTAGGDLGGAYPTPTVLKASGTTLDLAGCLNATLAHGTVLTTSGILDARMDSLSAVRIQSDVADTVAGTNGTRRDSIVSDARNARGASFFMNSFVSGIHNTRGSYQGHTSVATINEAREGDGIYGELGLYEAGLVTNRRGAYTACVEAMNAVRPGKQARATGLVSIIEESNALSTYTMLSQAWNDTGSRGLWVASNGAHPAGTGIFIDGDWARAALYVQFADQSNFLLLSRPSAASAPLFRINGMGKIEWGNARRITTNLYSDHNRLKTDGGFSVAGEALTLEGTAMLENGVAAHESSVARAGSKGPPPKHVAGYLTFRDSEGKQRKIAYFNA